MTAATHIEVDLDAFVLRTRSGSLPWGPAPALPLRSTSVDAVSFTGGASTPSRHVMALLREARRAVVEGGLIRVAAEPARAAGAELGAEGPHTSHPEPGLDRLARYTGLELAVVEPDAVRLMKPRVAVLDDPLVSILVPGYRTTFIESVLESALGQTWSNVEVLVGDDSADDELRAIVAQHGVSDHRLRYIGRAPERGGRANMAHLVAEAGGDYIKFLNDDDLLAPTCVEKMATCLRDHPGVSLVTSHRTPIDADGRELQDLHSTHRRVSVDSVIDGASAARDLIELGYNWLGEPSTTMYRRTAVDVAIPFGVVDEPASSSGDIAMWLKLLGRGDLIYLTESLSSFRQHDAQRQKQPEFLAVAQAGLDSNLEQARHIGLGEAPGQTLPCTDLELRPWWPEAARSLVRSLTLDNAAQHLPALHEMLPDDPAVALLGANVALAHGDANTAVEILDAAADKRPDAVGVLKMLAIALLHLDAVRLAHRILWFAHDLCPYDQDIVATIEAISDEHLEPA